MAEWRDKHAAAKLEYEEGLQRKLSAEAKMAAEKAEEAGRSLPLCRPATTQRIPSKVLNLSRRRAPVTARIHSQVSPL